MRNLITMKELLGKSLPNVMTHCVKRGISNSAEGKEAFTDFASSSQLCYERDPLCASHADLLLSDERDIINEREKLKETDEYKQAIEEEWAARQRQLQIQAEEARRLRKRRKAETLRILDMERRQKQRLEEVRETQKKDEENLNKKERFRVEVRKSFIDWRLHALTWHHYFVAWESMWKVA
ncbi:hypothetical protein NC652_027071 [Populus alba x Populus x berolinensis]|nr:hypothetical protein NC652_027071 [Populus alba x Populus x berolinensis]